MLFLLNTSLRDWIALTLKLSDSLEFRVTDRFADRHLGLALQNLRRTVFLILSTAASFAELWAMRLVHRKPRELLRSSH